MALTPEELEEFKTHYEHVFNVRLSDEEAVELASRLDELYRIVLDRSSGADDAPKPAGAPWWRKPQSEGEGRGSPA
jgi:hypothetical protein